eukprot:Rhum_TRINITY_DN14829_c5_g1::Rhum_TRINITY_DN14829_c5_g1_i1::g.121873::m.121873
MDGLIAFIPRVSFFRWRSQEILTLCVFFCSSFFFESFVHWFIRSNILSLCLSPCVALHLLASKASTREGVTWTRGAKGKTKQETKTKKNDGTVNPPLVLGLQDAPVPLLLDATLLPLLLEAAVVAALHPQQALLLHLRAQVRLLVLALVVEDARVVLEHALRRDALRGQPRDDALDDVEVAVERHDEVLLDQRAEEQAGVLRLKLQLVDAHGVEHSLKQTADDARVRALARLVVVEHVEDRLVEGLLAQPLPLVAVLPHAPQRLRKRPVLPLREAGQHHVRRLHLLLQQVLAQAAVDQVHHGPLLPVLDLVRDEDVSGVQVAVQPVVAQEKLHVRVHADAGQVRAQVLRQRLDVAVRERAALDELLDEHQR